MRIRATKNNKDIVKERPKMDDTKPFDDIDLGEDMDIDKMFGIESNQGQDNVKELFHESKVKARTDLTPRQINNITKAFYLAKMSGIPEISGILNDFLTLRISKDRKSRAEFVDGLKARIEQNMQQGMQNIRGQFGK